MKSLLSILITLLLPLCLVAQPNLVYNGSFEQVNVCTGTTSNGNITGWTQYIASPDHYSTCTNNAPANNVGFQHAASGQAYIGIIDFNSPTDYGAREAFTSYITPMQIGQTYEVSMSVSVANRAYYFTNSMCVHFFDTGAMTHQSFTGTLPFTPKISFANYGQITDTQNWVRLTATFIADSAYDHIAVGGFLNATSVSYSATGFNPAATVHYILIDSVVVKLYDSLAFTFTDNTLCAGDTITMPYYSKKKKQSNNVFTLQMSNASGSFATPINIGSITSDTSGTITGIIPTNTSTGTGYRLRLVASNYADTSDVGIALKIGNGLAKPDANNNGPVCTDDTIKLTATTTTAGVGYRWSGPNLFTSELQHPTITSPLPVNGGNYIVTAYLHGCEAKDTTTVVISGSGPSGIAATTNAPVCIDDTLKLFGTANGSGNTYSWTGPNSFTANTQNAVIPVATVQTGGDYILYANNGTCVGRDTITVVIKPRPAAFSGTCNSPVCAGEAINFSASSTSTGVTYGWTGPNGFNAAIATPSIGGASATHNGDYYVTATLNGCPLKDTVTVVVKPLPVKPVANSNAPLCAGETLNLTAASTTAGVSYSWTGANSFASTTQNPSISNSTTGTSGDYIVTATLNGCSSKDTTTVLVKPLPTTVTTSSNSPLCAGAILQLTASNSTTGSTYTWTGPNNFTDNSQNTGITNSTAAATGWYVATVNLNGCTTKDSVFATVNAIPASPTASYNSPLCVGQTLNLSATNVTGATYSWTGVGGYTANIQNPTRPNMQFGDTGMYNVTATVNGCTSPAGTVRVGINPSPFVVILANPGDSVCTGNPVVFTALPNNHGGTPLYQWYVNNSPVTTGALFNTTALANGDVVRCDMTENTKCSSPYTDASNDITMNVLPWLTPSVTFTANPNRPLSENEFVTFTATSTNAGNNPTYQWKRNGQNVQGATGSVWSANTLNDNDSISVEVISSYKCPQPLKGFANGVRVKILSGVGDVNNIKGLTVYPNPNNGRFVVSGNLEANDEVTIALYNTVGQNIYTKTFTPTNKTLNHEVNIPEKATGIYLVKITQSGQTAVSRFVVN